MFPRLNAEQKDTAPFSYFDGYEPPTYYQIPLPAKATIQEISQLIYKKAFHKNICGYITDTEINYFIDERGRIQIDASKDFIFVAERGIEPFTHPTPLGILRFMQDPCDRAIFISEGSALYLEKTPKTYELCAELDEIWDDYDFFENVMEIVDHDDYEQFNLLLPLLMKEYEKRNTGSVLPLWDDIEANKIDILEHKMFLRVERFVVE